MGLPEVIVLDRDPAFLGATFRHSAAALGIRLHFAAVDDPGAPCRVAGLQRWLTATVLAAFAVRMATDAQR